MMGSTIRARVRGGVLEPLEKIDLPEEVEVLVTIEIILKNRALEGLHRSFGGWKDTVDAEKLKRDIYEDRLVSTRLEPRL